MSSAGLRPLHKAMARGDSCFAYALVESGVDIEERDYWGQPALHWAIEFGQKRTLSLLLEAGADIEAKDDCNWTPLHRAVCKGNTEILSLLLKKGATPDCAVTFAETMTDLKPKRLIVEELLRLFHRETGFPVRVDDTDSMWRPIHLAAYSGNAEMIEQLLNAESVDVNATTESGLTPLHIAAIRGCKDVAVALLEAGADIEIGSGIVSVSTKTEWLP